MPSNILSTDTLYPAYQDGADVQSYLQEVSDYLFLLKEQLGYSLHNLGVANFNAAQLAQIGGLIRDPIFARLEDTDGNVASLSVTASGLLSRLDNYNGTSSTIEQTTEGIRTTVTSLNSSVGTLETSYSQITQTVNSISSTVATISTDVGALQTNYSSITQTVNSISTSVSTINNNYISKTTATQTASGFSLSVTNSSGTGVMALLNSAGLTVYNGAISIRNNAGNAVMYADVNGNLFLTGVVSASTIYGSTFYTSSITSPNSGAYIVMTGDKLSCYYNGVLNGVQILSAFTGQAVLNLNYNGAQRLQLTCDNSKGYVYGASILVLKSASYTVIGNYHENNIVYVSDSEVSISAFAINAKVNILSNNDILIQAYYSSRIYLYGHVYINGVYFQP